MFQLLFARLRPSVLLLLLAYGPVGVGRANPPVEPPLDSLRARLAHAGLPDTTRVLYLTQLCSLLHTTDLPAARRTGVQAVALARRIGFGRGEAGALASLAAIDYYSGDYPAAERTFEATLNVSQRLGLSIPTGHAWLGLGNVAQALNNIPRALQCFEQARTAYATARPPYVDGEVLVLNNSANAYNLLKQPARASRAFRQALALVGPGVSAHLVVGLHDGLGGLQQAAGHLDSAQMTLERGLVLALRTDDLQGEAGLRGQLAEVELARTQPARARAQAERALALARQVGDPFLEEDALNLLAGTLHALRRSDAYDTLRAYLVLHDTILAHDRTDAIIEAQTRFDVAGQQARIRGLEQEQRITSLKAERAALRTRWLVGWLVLAAVLLAAGVAGWFRRREARHDAALRAGLAADLHDDVGSLLTQLTIQSGLLRETAATDQQRARLDQLADTSRRAALHLIDVVWSLDAANDTFGQLLERLREHAHDVLGTAEIGVEFLVEPGFDPKGRLAPDVRQHVYLVFKEALHNVVKHARASRVTIKVAPAGRGLELYIHDNGPHLIGASAAPSRPGGRGVTSMRTRAQALGGTLALEPSATGFGVRLQVPR